jgi:hypothetical protein
MKRKSRGSAPKQRPGGEPRACHAPRCTVPQSLKHPALGPEDDYGLRIDSKERDIWSLIGSVVSAAILVVSARISPAWLANTSN